jgi:hypothetical protein
MRQLFKWLTIGTTFRFPMKTQWLTKISPRVAITQSGEKVKVDPRWEIGETLKGESER